MFSLVWLCIVFNLWRSVNCRVTVKSITLGKTSWGTWGNAIYCPEYIRVRGFKLQVQPKQGSSRDDTALNGIRLYCADESYSKTITGSWGAWTSYKYCNTGKYITKFTLRSEGFQGNGNLGGRDDTAANNVKVKCNDNKELLGYGLNYGSWAAWSQCPSKSYFCGVQARIERPTPGVDNTALNQLKFICCKSGSCNDVCTSWTGWGTCKNRKQGRSRKCPARDFRCTADGNVQSCGRQTSGNYGGSPNDANLPVKPDEYRPDTYGGSGGSFGPEKKRGMTTKAIGGIAGGAVLFFAAIAAVIGKCCKSRNRSQQS